MVSAIETFKKRVKEVEDSIRNFENIKEPKFAVKSEVLDYTSGRAKYLQSSINSSLLRLKEGAWELLELGQNPQNRKILLQIISKLESEKKEQPTGEIKKLLAELLKLADSLTISKTVEEDISFIKVPKMPDVIADEIAADLNELRKCFVVGANRSCVVLCGRVLETALNRKYFEITGQDLMETAPGTGLGNLVGKLKEKEVKVDPGLTQQIHLINQVRVFSVHSKKEAFYPSKEQSQAIILFTLDALKKLFG